jgi:signal transduction histidine kinase
LQQDNQLSHLYLWITVSLSLMALVIVGLVYYYYKKGKKHIRSLLLLNSEIGEQRDKLEFATVELGKSNAEKERILRVVAHDLRDPIGGAATIVNMVINEDLPGEFELQNLNLVEKTLGNSMALINELLVFEPNPERLVLELTPADIHEIALQCTGLMQLIAAKKDQKITLLSPEAPLMIGLDKARIERMLNNLLGNAIKFSPAGETIIMEIKKQKNDVLIMVKDNGIGIPAPMQGELFSTFSNTRRVGTAGEKSFGLGLSMCKQIVEAHGGKIWVESIAGNGSAFFVELPFQQ